MCFSDWTPVHFRGLIIVHLAIWREHNIMGLTMLPLCGKDKEADVIICWSGYLFRESIPTDVTCGEK